MTPAEWTLVLLLGTSAVELRHPYPTHAACAEAYRVLRTSDQIRLPGFPQTERTTYYLSGYCIPASFRAPPSERCAGIDMPGAMVQCLSREMARDRERE